MHTAGPFVLYPRASEFEDAIGKLKRYKSPGVVQIPTEILQAGGDTKHSEIHKLIMLIWKKEKFPRLRKYSIVESIHRKGDKTVCSNYRGITLLSKHTNF
jgi:hypothetical protein